MVLLEGAAGMETVHNLWDYNRENYLYDREMRQEQEFQIAEYRIKQAELWRQDVDDLIGLTEKKMDAYLIICTLQLGMSITLFTEGRLEPGTPPWLLRLYMLTLGAAFVYLLMAVWLAMHASVVAQSSKVRILTQLVRLPIPTWEQIEAMRTYSVSYESLGAQQMLRVPFVDTRLQKEKGPRLADHRPPASTAAAGFGIGVSDSAASSTARHAHHDAEEEGTSAVDPWGLERHGGDIYELQAKPTVLLRHVELVRRAAAHYQCYDAYARVAMTLGTNQLLLAITYYVLGYCLVQDAAPWAAWSVAALLVSVAATLIQLDLSLTQWERKWSQALLVMSPTCASCAVLFFSTFKPEQWTGHWHLQFASSVVLPFTYFCGGAWLYWVFTLCKAETLANGARLPIKFRSVLYLDVFGWLFERPARVAGKGSQAAAAQGAGETFTSGKAEGSLPDSESRIGSREVRGNVNPRDLEEALRQDIAVWESSAVQGVVSEEERARIDRISQRFRAIVGLDDDLPIAPEVPPPPDRWLKLRGSADTGLEVPYLYNPQSSEVMCCDSETGGSLDGSASASAPVDLPRPPLSLSFTEGELDSFCDSFADRQSFVKSSRRHRAATGEDSVSPSQRAAWREDHLNHLTHLFSLCQEPEVVTATEACAAEATAIPGRNAQTESEQKSALDHTVSATRHAYRKALNHPRPNDDRDHPLLRPEDIDVLHAEAQVQAHLTKLRRGVTLGSDAGPCSKAVKGIGPSNAVPEAHADAFAPSSFYPRGNSAAGDHRVAAAGEKIATGHDKTDPGEIPSKVFRKATVLIVWCWATAFILSVIDALRHTGPGGASFIHTVPLPKVLEKLDQEPSESQTSNSAEPDRRVQSFVQSLPALSGGERVVVRWPQQYSFSPRMMGADTSGTKLVVADDFGVYSGDVESTSRRLGWSSDDVDGGSGQDRGQRFLAAHFEREPPCTALEGQKLADISLACSRGLACHVIVLHARGRRLAECPLASHTNAAGRSVEPSVLWSISDGWLNTTRERVQSLGVDDDCRGKGDALDPKGPGCLIVGTTSGRIVQLRRHVSEEGQLVPEWAMRHRSRQVMQGSIHVLPGGLVILLRPELGTVQVLDAWEGGQIGEWRLPRNVTWSALSGGGDSLFFVGRELPKQTEAMLWRFPVPEELRARQETRRQGALGDASGHVDGRDAEM